MTKKQLLINIGGVSNTRKMPCESWSLSAFWCNNGGKLNKVKNSSCYGCKYDQFASNYNPGLTYHEQSLCIYDGQVPAHT